MTDTSTSVAAPASSVSPGHIFHRMSLPVLLFCAVFATAMGISHIAILPALTSVEVGGVVRNAAELQSHADKLTTKLSVLEQNREADILPMDGTEYRALVDAKINNPSATELLDAFRLVARSIVPEVSDAIVITAVRQDIAAKSLTLTGDVSGVGPGSMTVLAQLTEVLRDDSRVASLVAPNFTRLEDPKIGPHSPFTIIITLQ